MGSMPDWTSRISSKVSSKAKKISKPKNPVAANLQKSQGEEGLVISRSPKDSPPTMKKKLCRLISGIVDADVTSVDGAFDALIGSSAVTSEGKGSPKYRTKRMSRTESQSAAHTIKGDVAIPKRSILKNGYQSGSKMRVRFKPDVTVHYMGQDGDVFCSDCQRLNESESEKGHVHFKIGQTPYATKTPTLVYDSPPSPPDGPMFLLQQDDVTSSGAQVRVTHDTVDSSQVNFTFVEDAARGTVLKFTIALGRDYRPEDIVVKANVSGSKVRLVANKRLQYPDGSMRIDQLSRRYILPMDVDPYLVTARLDIKGNLNVEAPLLTLTRREAMRKPDQYSSSQKHH